MTDLKNSVEFFFLVDVSSDAGAKLAVKFGDVLILGKTEALKNQYWTI